MLIKSTKKVTDLCPEGEYPAELKQVTYKNENKKCLFHFETGPEGKKHLVPKEVPSSFDAGPLRKDLELLNSGEFTTKQVEDGIDPEKFVGRKCRALVVHKRTPNPKTRPNATGFGPGTYEQIEKLAQLRGISIEGLLYAQERGVLAFGSPWGFEVYAVMDQSGRLIEARCLDGNNFGATGELAMRTSHVLSGSQMDWPLGILEAKNFECVALVAGFVEFLTLHHYIVKENAQDRVAPVAMLSTEYSISPDALDHFKGKHVRIYPCQDKAGIESKDKWGEQLLAADVKKLEVFNFSACQSREGHAVKDLCEFTRLNLRGSDFAERTILP